jgi:[protein-PII] uridylyltransferase
VTGFGEQVLPSLAATPPRGAELWLYLGEILAQPHAAHALCAMHSLRLLTLLLPELKTIESLVVRDFYHRFTVDEHSNHLKSRPGFPCNYKGLRLLTVFG